MIGQCACLERVIIQLVDVGDFTREAKNVEQELFPLRPIIAFRIKSGSFRLVFMFCLVSEVLPLALSWSNISDEVRRSCKAAGKFSISSFISARFRSILKFSLGTSEPEVDERYLSIIKF